MNRRSFSSVLILLGLLGVPPTHVSAQVSNTPDSLANPTGQVGEPLGIQETEAAPSPVEKTDPMSFSCSQVLASRYLFQGIDYSEGRAVVQPTASASFRNLSASFWGNWQIDQGVMNEIDLSLSYTHSFRRLGATAGYVNLHYPHRQGWDPSQEAFLDLSFSAPVEVSLSLHYDIDAGDGLYSTLGLRRPLGSVFSVGTNLFYQAHYYEASGIPSAELNARAERSIGPFVMNSSVSRFLTWQNQDFRGELAVPANWLFTLGLTREF